MLEIGRALFFGDNLDIVSAKRLPIWFLLLTSAGACTSRPAVNQPLSPVAPTLTVERFLQAANVRDLETMSRLFGSADGPFGDTRDREVVELQMNVIAEILQHDDYDIISEGAVPGSELPSRRIGVDFSLPNGLSVGDVGFTVVLESADRWLVNEIEVTRITEGA